MLPNNDFLSQSMYNIDNSIETPKSSGPIPAGIQENVNLVGVYFESLRSDGTGGNVLKFNFEDAAGRKFRHTEFEVEVDRVRANAKQWGKDPEASVRNALTGLAGRIKHILSCFLPADKVVITGNTWDEFGGNVVAILGDAFRGVDVRVKLILNNKDYTMFPKQAFRPFIQRMDTPNTLAVDTKWERTEPKSSGASTDALDALLSDVPAAAPAAPAPTFEAPAAPAADAPAPWDTDAPAPSLSAPNNDDLVF
jgi:hypothetical protein